MRRQVLDQRANMGVSSSPARPRACSTNVVEQCLARFGQCVRTGQNDLRVTLHEKQYIRVQTFLSYHQWRLDVLAERHVLRRARAH
jgi:hypothetical protein